MNRFRLGVSLIAVLAAGCGSDPAAPTDASTPVDGASPIGAAGGTVFGPGVNLTVPPGALDAPVVITITRTSEPIPPGYIGYSPVWRFAPEGLRFAVPATVQMTFEGDASRAGLHWTRLGAAGYERLPGTVSAGTAHVPRAPRARPFTVA